MTQETDSGSSAAASLGDVTDEMPQPQEHAIAAEESDEAEKAKHQSQWTGYTDKHGNSFDPAIHKTDANGDPVLTRAGKLSLKPGKAQSAHANRTGSGGMKSTLGGPGAEKGGPQGQPSEGPGSGSPEAAGQMIAENIFMIGQLIGGEEWAPIETWNPEVAKQYGFNERQFQYQAWTAYCREKQISDIPPNLMVVFVMGQYVGLRLSMPKTRTRMQKFRDWASVRIQEWRRKRGSGKDARSSSGNDTKRQDERGEESGA